MISIQNAKQNTWATGCRAWTLLSATQLSVKEEHMEPGTAEQEHFHRHATQFFYILKGTAILYINKDEPVSVSEGQGIEIKPKEKHYVANQANEALHFLVISQPDTQNDRINTNSE